MTVEVFTSMIGKTMEKVEASQYGDEMSFYSEGKRFMFYHSQGCCESVSIEDIAGDLSDLVGSPIIMAEQVSNVGEVPECGADSYTWTFYRFATANGSVTVRWLGTSNGYYSEDVCFEESNQPIA